MGQNEEGKEIKGNTEMYAALSFALVMLILGIPLWWNTTAVQRAPLPYSEIEALPSTSFRQKTLIYLQCLTSETCSAHFSSLQKARFDVDVDIGLAVSNTTFPIQVADHEHTSLSSEAGSIHLIEVQELSKEILFGRRRNIYFSSNTGSATLVKVLDEILSSSTSRQRALTTQKRAKHVSVSQLRHLPSASHYNVLLSLIRPTPTTNEIVWNPQTEIKEWLGPFLNKLEPLASITIRSQVVYADAIDLHPTWDEVNKRFHLNEHQLPLLLNPLDSKLGTQTSTAPSIHWAVWVPPTQYTPLYFRWSDQDISNVFLSPKWGGLMVYNEDSHQVNMKVVLLTLLPHLRLQLGLPKQTFPTVAYDNSGLHDWELDYLMRNRADENLRQAASTVQALIQLLDQISNIVISQGVADDIRLAVNTITEAQSQLSNVQLETGFLLSRQALEAADRAFFHPSLLALLYFPDDQKYAIYIPLFLPVGIPVILSLKSIFLWLCSKMKPTRVKTD